MQKQHTATDNGIRVVFFAVLFTISLVTTFLYGYHFAPAIAPDFLGWLQPIAAGLILAVTFDLSALLWNRVRTQTGVQTPKQVQTAKMMSLVTFAGAALLTFVYLIITSVFLDVDAVGRLAGILGMVITPVVIVCNFYGIYTYTTNSPEALQKEQDAELYAAAWEQHKLAMAAELKRRSQRLVRDALTTNLPLYETDILSTLTKGANHQPHTNGKGDAAIPFERDRAPMP